MKKRVGLFGGTFDPVHIGHEALATSFIGSGQVDELWVLLTPDPPHKSQKTTSDYQHRLNMLKMAFAEMSSVRVSTIENSLPAPSYTIQTLSHLCSLYPEYEFILCIGEDSLNNFHTWKDYKEILKLSRLLVAQRPEINRVEIESDIQRQTDFVNHSPVDISSSEIRDFIRSGKESKEYLRKDVWDYIISNNLYN